MSYVLFYNKLYDKVLFYKMGNDVVGCMVLWVCKEVNLVSYSIDVY